MQNRRKETRYRVRFKGIVRSEGRKLRVQTENLSIIGARIALDRPLLEGVSVSLELTLSKDEAPVQLTGSVVWCSEDMDVGFQAGISFTADGATAERLKNRCIGCPTA